MTETPLEKYRQEADDRIKTYADNEGLQSAKEEFFNQIGIGKADYVYNFFWLGVPIIQIPQDLQAMQEMIWAVKPDLIIEAGVAWGGSIVFSASMLAILEACNAIQDGLVVGVDIDIRAHNRENLNQHPLSHKYQLIEGSSIDPEVVDQVKEIAKEKQRVMVFLDSNHTHDHVLAELRHYAPMVPVGGYIMVGDTVIESAPDTMTSERPWNKTNNPKTAVWQFVKENPNFVIDKRWRLKLC